MKTKTILIKEAMSYKEQIKGNELITKFKIIRDVKVNKLPKTSVANKYGMHRNWVWKIIRTFERDIGTLVQNELLDSRCNFSKIEIEDKLNPIFGKSKKPLGNKRNATKEQENLIIEYHSKYSKIWYKRMHMLIKRKLYHVNWSSIKLNKNTNEFDKNIDKLKWITFSKIKWIYKRNNLKCRKVRTASWWSVALYDYTAIQCFEFLHYDTKSILDKKALPEDIYKKFKLNKNLPIIEWNIFDAKSRFRFIAYSHERTSIFWLNFLIFVIQFIRTHNIISHELKIIIGTDNGSEFYQGSVRKEKEWNDLLWIINAEIYSYEPWFDVRKNLIERSHKTDDEEFFVPRWSFINGKKSFLIEAKWYSDYLNKYRPHSWICMNDKTPIEKLKSCWIYNADRLLEFPTMILEDNAEELLKATEIVRIIWKVNNDRNKLNKLTTESRRFNFDQKYEADLKANFKNYNFISAHYVLTYYHILKSIL